MYRTVPMAGLGLLALFAVPAAAADRPLPRTQEWPSYVAPRTYNWNGLYAGLHAGGAFDRFDGATARKSRNEILLGGQVGYNLQLGNMVFGMESDLSMNGFGKGSRRGGGTSADMRYLGTLKARAGVAFDRVLVYGTGGLDYGGFKATPGSGNVFAASLAKGEMHPLAAPFSIDRFYNGALIDEHGAAAVAH